MAARTAIGLDIGTSSVRAAELSFTGSGVVLERFGQVSLPPGAVRDGEVVDDVAVADALRQLWAGTRMRSRKVVLGVANHRVVVRGVDVPWMPRAELAKALPFQVGDLLPMPVEDAVLDFLPLQERTEPDGARSLHGLLVAASRDSVLANVRCVQKAGLVPMTVDLTSFALLRSVATRGDLDVETEAVVDIGARVTNVVVHSAGTPSFVRILLMGGQDVTDAVAERVGVPLAEAEALKVDAAAGVPGLPDGAARAVELTAQALVDEIRGSLDYHAASTTGRRLDRVVLTGGGSRLGGLAERLSAATRLPVVHGDPLGGLRIGRTGLDDDQLALVTPLAAVPVGLAMGVAA